MAQVELEEKLVKEEQKSLQMAKQEETTVAGQRLEQNKVEVSCVPFKSYHVEPRYLLF